jgi:hypothetical protein
MEDFFLAIFVVCSRETLKYPSNIIPKAKLSQKRYYAEIWLWRNAEENKHSLQG